MSLYFTAVVGIRLSYRDSMLGDDATFEALTNYAYEADSKLQAAEIPNAHCEYFSAWEYGESVFQIGSRLSEIRAADSGEYMSDGLPELTPAHKQAIEQVAADLIEDLRKQGVTADIARSYELSITCSS